MEPTKICSRCWERHPWSNFYTAGRGYLKSYCKPCDHAKRREIRAADPEREARWAREYYARLMSDQKRHAQMREGQRFAFRRRCGVVRIARPKKTVEHVDAQSFVSWLQGVMERDGIGTTTLAKRLGMPDNLRQWINGTRGMVSVAVVDAALCAEGGSVFADLYPDWVGVT